MNIRSPKSPTKYVRSVLVFGALLTILFSHSAFADDLSITFDNSIGSADYLLGSKLIEGASYGTSSFTISSILTDKLRAYIDVSHMQVYPYSDYSSNDGEVGLQFRYLEIKDNQVFGGLYAFINRFHDSYSYYNSDGFGAYLKWKHYFKASQLIIGGYDLNIDKYDEVAEASNAEHEIYFTYNQSFATRTSVNFRNAFAYQNFWNDLYEVEQIPDNKLIRTEMRLSQSIGQKIGLTGWLNYQSILNESAGLFLWQTAINNPFIDRFRWAGPSASMRLSYRVNPRNSLKLVYSYREKEYLDVPVYAYDFANQEYLIENEAYVDLGMDRSDDNTSIQLSWNLILDPDLDDWVPGIEAVINAGWTMNNSNDPLYDYPSKNYSITLNINN